ncbi:MAG: ribulose-bisphosphate carboxylase large subunit family protein [Chloroflexota bacterium]|nr:ribulose-bisphosphate carboxylase large subunit family protein [Chloroflexota bacterium]
MSDIVRATYLIETAHPLERAAAIMAGEQSAGTFVPVPGETPELLARHGAKVERITELETVESPSLPGSKPPKGSSNSTIRRAEVVLTFPLDNIGISLTTLFTTIAGNLYELSPFSGLRLMDVDIPPIFASRYPGAAFGVDGTRRLTDVQGRPILGTIIKPSVGLSPEQTAELVKTLCEAGLDFIKDDELQTDSPHSPLSARVEAVMRIVNDHAQRTGKHVMFAFNVTGDIDAMQRGHDTVAAHGGTCIMVNLVSVGLAGVIALRRHSQLPIHGHRAGWGMLSRQPLLGMDYTAFQKLFRWAGADHLHVNGIRNKFCESDESVIRSARACLTPLEGTPNVVMPVFSSGQTAEQAPDTFAALGSSDLMYLAGGGIMAHPGGAAAGVRAIQQAWAAAARGVALADAAHDYPELAAALERFAR